MLPVPMAAAAPSSPHSLATASGLLLGTVGLAMAVGALLGWLVGSAGIGLLLGAILGMPLSIGRRLHRLLARGIVNARVFETPRPVPGRLVPALAGSAVVALALPVFVAAGCPLRGWLLAATLWLAGQLFALLLTRLPLGTGNLAAAGMRGIGTSFRALLIGIPLVAVTAADERLGMAAAGVYVLAFTVELAVSLVEYFGQEARA